MPAPSDPESRTLAPVAPPPSGNDRLDEAALTTPVRSLVAVAACLLLAAGVVVWAVTARVDQTVSASGVSLVGGSLERVVSHVDGTITELGAGAGDEVRRGQVLARVASNGGGIETLTAPTSGRVLNAPYAVGVSIVEDEAVMVIEAIEGERQVRVFLDPLDAEKVSVGTETVIAFPGRAEIRGRVTEVSALPIDRDQVATLLGSPALAGSVLTSDSAVALTVVPSDGAPLPVPSTSSEGGRVARVTFVVDTVHPVEYVI